MKEFNKKTLDQLRVILNAALQSVTMECGVDFVIGRIRFQPQTATITIEGTVEGGENKEETDYNDARVLLPKLPPLFSTIIMPGIIAGDDKQYKLIGYRRKNRKYPIIATELKSGRRFKLPLQAVYESDLLIEKPKFTRKKGRK